MTTDVSDTTVALLAYILGFGASMVYLLPRMHEAGILTESTFAQAFFFSAAWPVTVPFTLLVADE